MCELLGRWMKGNRCKQVLKSSATIRSQQINLRLDLKKSQYEYDILKYMINARKKHNKDQKLLISGEWDWVNGGLIFLLQAFRAI